MLKRTMILLAAALLAALPCMAEEADAALPEMTEQPFLTEITEDDPAVAYVLVRMPDPVGLLPLPLEGEYTRTIRQVMADAGVARRC